LRRGTDQRKVQTDDDGFREELFLRGKQEQVQNPHEELGRMRQRGDRKMTTLKGRIIYKGNASGEVLKTNQAISFYGGVNGDTGVVEQEGHELKGQCIAGKILVFPEGKGSTVGSYVLYRLKKNGKAPLGMITKTCETIVAVGCIIGEIPCLDKIEIEQLKTGMKISMDCEKGTVKMK